MKFSETLREYFREAGAISQFAGRFFQQSIRPRNEWSEFFRQCYVIGYQSLPLIGLTGFIMGLVLTMQLRPSLIEYGVESQLPAMVGIAIVREIGPVITALIFAGKIGSSIGAELGSMRVTEQIDAMEVSGTNPFKYLVVTRVLATSIAIPILATYTGFIAILGGYLNVATNEGTSYTTFMQQVFEPLTFVDFVSSLIKSIVF